MAKAGADIIVCHMGLTTGGAIGAETALKLADCPALVDAWAAAALQGATATSSCCATAARSPTPEDAAFILQQCHELPRLLRRLLHGAPADRDGADRADAHVQGASRSDEAARRSTATDGRQYMTGAADSAASSSG